MNLIVWVNEKTLPRSMKIENSVRFVLSRETSFDCETLENKEKNRNVCDKLRDFSSDDFHMVPAQIRSP
jgi:hypothetical protein